jgi:hypothetical protein
MAALAFRSRYDRWKLIIAAAKAIYGLVGTFLLVSSYKEPLGYLLPWSWLVLIPTKADNSLESAGSFARTFLCLAAIWEGLQAYPSAETQAVLGTFLPVLVYSICLHDALKSFGDEPWIIRHLGTFTPRAVPLGEALVLAGLVYLCVDWFKPFSGWRSYKSLAPLGLRGSDHLRLPADQAETYRALTQYLESQSDLFITIPGLNSLYFWTGTKPPTYFNASEVAVMNDSQQAQIVAALQDAKRPLIVMRTRGGRFAYPNGPLRRLIREQCREVKKIGSFRILELERTTTR